MLIQNTSTEIMYLGFVNNGVELDPGETYDIEETLSENETFQYMENLGLLTILSYDTDFTRLTVRSEVTAGGIAPGVTLTESTFISHFDAPSVDLGTLTPGRRLQEVSIEIQTAFTPGTTLTVGFSGDEEAIVPASYVAPDRTNTYVVELNRLAVAAELLKVFINGSPTQGEAIVYVLEVV